MFSFGNNVWQRLAGRYLFFSLGCMIFGAVYECFSHGVISLWMILMFLWPLLLGSVPFFLMRKKKNPPDELWLYHAGVITLTAGSCMKGILEIYGSSTPYLPVYWFLGGGLLGLFLMLSVFRNRKRKKNQDGEN